MNLSFCNITYHTTPFDDFDAGCAGLELIRTSKDQTARVGKITFWDASGQFFIELTGSELPLDILEKFISETREVILTK